MASSVGGGSCSTTGVQPLWLFVALMVPMALRRRRRA
jgi:MYXO-CTERM domain-containing protein